MKDTSPLTIDHNTVTKESFRRQITSTSVANVIKYSYMTRAVSHCEDHLNKDIGENTLQLAST